MRNENQPGATKKAIRTRHQIVHAALELFKERGFDETTMRDVAKKSELSVGSTYYYFKTKEALVLAFYVESCDEFVHRTEEILKESKDFKYLLAKVLEERLAQLHPYRPFLGALIRSGLDPNSECSPFSDATADIRASAIKVFDDLLERSGLKVPSQLRLHLPRLLWLYHLGVILFWVYDSSSEQKKSRRLIEGTVGFIVAGLKIVRLPLMSTLLKPLFSLFEELFTTPPLKGA